MRHDFTLPVPPTVNTYWRHVVMGGSARVLISKRGRSYKAQVALIVPAEPIDGPICVTLTVYRPAKRGDLDNYLKSLLDSLKGLAYHDDSQIVRIVADRAEDKANPRVTVTVESFP